MKHADSITYAMVRRILTLLPLVACCLWGHGVTAAPASRASDYIDLYGLANPAENMYIERAQSIFDRIKFVSGLKNSGAKLIVVSSQSKPWAVALADGNIVLSEGAVSIVYSAKDLETSDAWMAFVLGHELAHLKNSDLWHHQVHNTLTANMSGDSSTDLQSVTDALRKSSFDFDQIKSKELKADEQGLLYSSLAGFDTYRLFHNTDDVQSFLEYWVDQTATFSDKTHHTATQRTKFLRRRLTDVHREVDLFQYGVSLAHFGRYQDALPLLRHFQKHFPSSAVLNNLGYLYLQLARKTIPVALAYRFWFPTMLESESGLPASPLRRSIDSKLPADARRHLEQAALLLTEAIGGREGDTLLAQANLITTYWYLGEMFKARAAVEEALSHWPDNHQLLGLKALVLLEQEPELDMWPRAKELLQQLITNGAADSNLIFNLARLLDERGRSADADRYWQQLLYLDLPPEYWKIVCIKTSTSCEAKESSTLNNPVVLPVPIGGDIGDPEIKRKLQGWKRHVTKTDAATVHVFTHPNGDSLLALDYSIQAVKSRTLNNTSSREVIEKFGKPRSVLPTSDGAEIWNYAPKWSLLVRDGVIEEAWTVQ